MSSLSQSRSIRDFLDGLGREDPGIGSQSPARQLSFLHFNHNSTFLRTAFQYSWNKTLLKRFDEVLLPRGSVLAEKGAFTLCAKTPRRLFLNSHRFTQRLIPMCLLIPPPDFNLTHSKSKLVNDLAHPQYSLQYFGVTPPAVRPRLSSSPAGSSTSSCSASSGETICCAEKDI